MGWFVGVVLLGLATAGCATVAGRDSTVRIVGLVREVAPQAGVLIVAERTGGTGAPRPILFCPATRILKLSRDSAHRLTTEPAAADQIRRGDLVDITARDDAEGLRAVEVRIVPEDGR